MLMQFPTPYPDEWWWSVLCRYFVRSGYLNDIKVIREMFPSPSRVHPRSLGRLFPSDSVYKAWKQLPEGVFSLESILLNHTLVPYYLRFHPTGKKRSMLQTLLQGQNVALRGITLTTPEGKQGLKWCPVCRREDDSAYGEPYWHRTHQIPLMSLCPKHGCRLILHEIPLAQLSNAFIPLSVIPGAKAVEGEHAWERPLSNVLQAFVMLPFETAITMAFINLEETLRGRGYSVKGKTTLDAPKVYADCYDFCGEEISAQYFSRVPPSQLYHICHWKLTAPERYALLAVMAGLTAEELFSRRRPLPNQHLEKLLALREKGEIYDKEALAGTVNLPLHEFNALTRKYDIQPFWIEDKAKESTPYAVNVILSAAEREQFKQALAQSGFRFPRHFAHHCILEYLNTHFSEED